VTNAAITMDSQLGFVDPLGSTATTAVLPLDMSVPGAIEVAGDLDWYRVALAGGTSYRIDLGPEPGSPRALADTYLRLHDATGLLIAQNDDEALGLLNSVLHYTPATGGTFYVSAGGYESLIGSFRVRIAVVDGSSSAGNDEIFGSAVNDYVQGGEGDDSIVGGLGEDWLLGEAGSDQLSGGAGADTLDGGLNADLMFGGDGDDSYYVDDIGDEGLEDVDGAAGGVDTVYSSASGHSLGFGIENLTLTRFADSTGSGNGNANFLIGNLGANTLLGQSGNDTLIGGDGNDSLDGGDGVDMVSYAYRQSGVTVSLATFGPQFIFEDDTDTLASVEQLEGSGYEDQLTGDAAANLLLGHAGHDTLDGATGADTLVGGDGNDYYHVDNDGDVVTEANSDKATGGRDTVTSTLASWTLPSNVEDLVLGTGAVTGSGNGLANTITGNTGATNYLNGGLGADTLVGGDGNDTYYVDNPGDVVTETNAVQVTGGRDTVVFSLASWTLGAHIEDLILGTGGVTGYGNGLNNYIAGNDAANNYLVGGAGADTMVGGDGNDTYYVDNAGDGCVETNAVQATGGRDTVVSTLASYALGANVEDLILGTGGVTAFGNSLNNYIAGNHGAVNYLQGGAGNDTMVGGDGNDTYYVDNTGDGCVETNADLATGGRDTVVSTLASYALGAHIEDLILDVGGVTAFGNSLNNFLYGNSGVNNYLVGGAGADTMVGGDGNDTYYVDNIGDGCVENNAVVATGGRDTVVSTLASYALGANVEDLILDTGGVTAFGNSLNNFLQGNAGAVNYLQGGAGNDTMVGGDGADTYYVDSAGDGCVETNADLATGGRDTVVSTLASYALGANIEDLILGTGGVTAFGNSLNNFLYGNAGAVNYLQGGGGNDTMVGGDGNDTYYVDSAGDGVVETNADLATGGRDTVSSSISYALGQFVEDLLLSGGAAVNASGNGLANYIAGNNAANILSGFDGNDWLQGDAGADTLLGGAGRDTLIGGLGADVFDFNALAESLTGANRDVVSDFSAAQGDMVDLSGIDANSTLTSDQAFSFIGAAAFGAVAGQLRFSGSILSGDTDGNGNADFEIQLMGVAGLVVADLVL
jgi:serralysin